MPTGKNHLTSLDEHWSNFIFTPPIPTPQWCSLMRYIAIILFLFLCACSSGNTVGTGPTPTLADDTPPTLTPAGILITNTDGPFSLTIISPADLAVVIESPVELRGEVSAEAVLTVNDEIYLLKVGDFSEPVTLQVGLNAIQITASDMDGNMVELVLTITYQP
jgi:hypothetical protein